MTALFLVLKQGRLAGSGRPGVHDLPLVEVPAHGAGGGGMMAVVLSGDGGWSGLEQGVAERLAREGIPVVGWNSLRYYRRPRAPQEAAEDLQRLVDVYSERWERPRVLLVGYSFGADVLPFLVNLLPAETRTRVAGVALVAIGRDAAFDFQPSDWLGRTRRTGFFTVPEARKMADGRLPVLCVYSPGDRETRTACPLLEGLPVRVVPLPGGHRFGGRWKRLGDAVVPARGQDGGWLLGGMPLAPRPSSPPPPAPRTRPPTAGPTTPRP